MSETNTPAEPRRAPRTRSGATSLGRPGTESALEDPVAKDSGRDTKDLALETAERLLHSHGYLGVSLETVAQGAGVRKASLYHHFPGGKTELLLTLAERLIARDERGIRDAIHSSPRAIERLHAVADWMFEQPSTERLLRDALRFTSDDDRQTLNEQLQRRLFAPVHAILEAGVETGELRHHDTRLSAWMFMGLLHELGEVRRIDPRPHLVSNMLELLINGLHLPPTPD
jgi:AcrR family transcriptional regulator